ncbi:plastocyanin [Arthrobacter sp. SDTb3-6]|nr:plastocyanin [Arthrobacter sp. SDTb3-6]
MRRRLENLRLNHLSSRKVPVLVAALLALLVPLALSGPAVADPGAGGQGPQTWTVLAGNESPDQAIQSMAFLPTDVYVDAGDTVTWQANSAEPHTVTFLPPGAPLMAFNPGDPTQLFPIGGSTYDGASYYNSGILTNVSDSGFPAVASYSLQFPTAGDFTYYCLVHGAMMKGTVHVAAAGTPYPYTQNDYNRQSRQQAQGILLDGRMLWNATAAQADSHHVYVGADDGVAMVMRYIQPTVRIHVGETVTFINSGMAAPHTVTFGTEPVNFYAPVGDPAAFAGGDLNSGLMLPGSTFTVTFTRAGTFSYICALHDYMGMVGTVVVG